MLMIRIFLECFYEDGVVVGLHPGHSAVVLGWDADEDIILLEVAQGIFIHTVELHFSILLELLEQVV